MALELPEALLKDLLDLWFLSPPDDQALLEGFRRVYADPVRVNGHEVPLVGLVAQVKGLHTAYTDLVAEVSHQVATATGAAIAFEMRGRHVGPLPTPVGTLEATGRTARVPTIELLTVEAGRITAVEVIADELVLLKELGVLPQAH